MADTIASDPITRTDPVTHQNVDVFKSRWGTTVYDYKLNGVSTDFQDLMVAISEHRATAVEGEVQPLSVRMRARNEFLNRLGTALAECSKKQAQFDSDDDWDEWMEGYFTSTTVSVLTDPRLGLTGASNHDGDYRYQSSKGYDADKAQIEALISKIKNAIDLQNNTAQTDMTRLQSLVDRRDESFTTATTLMTNVSDTRSNAIRNM